LRKLRLALLAMEKVSAERGPPMPSWGGSATGAGAAGPAGRCPCPQRRRPESIAHCAGDR
jgi:hypothetical protein